MTATVIDGKKLAEGVRREVARKVTARINCGLRPPGLAVVMVGDHPASSIYVRSKAKHCKDVGIRSFIFPLSGNTRETVLLELISQLNADTAVDGILVQLPLPEGVDAQRILAAINPGKDVDGFHPDNVGRLSLGLPGHVPCTPAGCLQLLDSVHASLAGLSAVIIGRSNIVGKPMAQLLLARNCTVTVAHSKTKSLPAICRQADILVAAIGVPQLVTSAWIKQGATVIDVGINRLAGEAGSNKGELVGDVAFNDCLRVAGAITPVPGGVGPMTIACLLSNTLQATCLRD